jgi:hypothetical protein
MPSNIPSVALMPFSMMADLLLPLLFIPHQLLILQLFFTRMVKEPELPLAMAIKLLISKPSSTSSPTLSKTARALQPELLQELPKLPAYLTR